MTDRKLLSVVIPVYNEETNIRPFYDRLIGAIKPLEIDAEIIFVDDGSSDRSPELIAELSQEDPRVRALILSRNFGSHPALSAGLHHANGDAAVLISVDLQDPPELITTLVERWREGYHVVWGVRESRDDPWMKKTLARLFYSVVRRIALPQFPPQGLECALWDRKVLNVLDRFPEVNRSLHMLVVWSGFRQTRVPYHRHARHSGVSKWPIRRRLNQAIDVFVAFSNTPIRMISYLGITISLLSFLYATFLLAARLLRGVGESGWPSLMVAILFLGGVQLVMLGILGEYLWRTSDQVRGRPLFIVMEEIGFDGAANRPSPPPRELP
ncbi:MAG: glycosyltransferase family 2 protein [bacterium]|nr:glycosyltransferase family 2 protein [bacterium]